MRTITRAGDVAPSILDRAGSARAHGLETRWVLGYKSAAHPERGAGLQAQLACYRARPHSSQAVRVAV